MKTVLLADITSFFYRKLAEANLDCPPLSDDGAGEAVELLLARSAIAADNGISKGSWILISDEEERVFDDAVCPLLCRSPFLCALCALSTIYSFR